MCHTTQSVGEHSGCPSGSGWWMNDRTVTVSYLPPLPVIDWSGMHHIGGRPTTITYLPVPALHHAA